MKTSADGRAFIGYFEGLFLKAYYCPAGVLTIGYGHTNAAGPPNVYPGMTITRQQADEILASDLAKVEAEVSRLVKVPLDQGQFDTLVSFHFNTGALGRSTLLRQLNAANYREAADELLKWDNAAGKKLAGLTRRRVAERKMFLSGGTPKQAPTKSVIATTAGTAAAVAAGWAWQDAIPWLVLIVIGAVVATIIYRIMKKEE